MPLRSGRIWWCLHYRMLSLATGSISWPRTHTMIQAHRSHTITRHTPECHATQRYPRKSPAILPVTPPRVTDRCLPSGGSFRLGARTALRERSALMGALRSCFSRTQTWLQAGKYVNALASELASKTRLIRAAGLRWPVGNRFAPDRRVTSAGIVLSAARQP